MSRAPIMSGTRKFPKPASMGMPTRNTMVVPCMVNIWLKPCGVRKSFNGLMSCRRIAVASRPATTKNTSPARMYITPSFL